MSLFLSQFDQNQVTFMMVWPHPCSLWSLRLPLVPGYVPHRAPASAVCLTALACWKGLPCCGHKPLHLSGSASGSSASRQVPPSGADERSGAHSCCFGTEMNSGRCPQGLGCPILLSPSSFPESEKTTGAEDSDLCVLPARSKKTKKAFPPDLDPKERKG